MHPAIIVIHHSLTKDSGSMSWQAIRQYHKKIGFSDIGYHFGIEKIKNRYEIIVGRGMNKPGAHCKQQQMNHKSIGVCFVGDFDSEPVPLAQWKIGVSFIRSLCQTLGIKYSSVTAHRDYADYKTCPGRMFDMGQFRADLYRGGKSEKT